MNKDLTMSIVAYNNYDDIKCLLTSIMTNTDLSLIDKIFIIDNGTKVVDDKTVMNFIEYLSKYELVEYINTGDNLGFGEGHNYIISNLSSVYHAIVNPDILVKENALENIIKYMEQNTDVGMVIPRIVNERGELQPVYRKEVTVWDMFIRLFCKDLFKKRQFDHTLQYKDYSQPFQVPFGQGSFLVIRTNLYKEIKGFDKNFFMYMEDADLSKRVNKISKLMYIPYSTVIHKWEKGSHKNLKLFKIHISSMIHYFKKWGIKLY